MHKSHYCTQVPDITNECIHGFEERKRLTAQYLSAYYALLQPQRRKGGVRLMVAPEVMGRALDRMVQPPTVVWALHADTTKQGTEYLAGMYRKANVKIHPGDIRKIVIKGRRKQPPEQFR